MSSLLGRQFYRSTLYIILAWSFPIQYFFWVLHTHETLVPFEVTSSGRNAIFGPFQKLLQGPMEVLLCELVNDLRHSLFHLFNCIITTAASELRE